MHVVVKLFLLILCCDSALEAGNGPVFLSQDPASNKYHSLIPLAPKQLSGTTKPLTTKLSSNHWGWKLAFRIWGHLQILKKYIYINYPLPFQITKQSLRIPTDWSPTSWLVTRVAEELIFGHQHQKWIIQGSGQDLNLIHLPSNCSSTLPHIASVITGKIGVVFVPARKNSVDFINLVWLRWLGVLPVFILQLPLSPLKFI